MSLALPRARALAPAGQGFSHLWSGVLAALTVALALVALDRVAEARMGVQATRLAELNLPENSRGLALQREIVRWPGCLPVYGSSELSMFQPTRADLYFRDHPSGFRVVLIGHGGDRCLLILQELAALGPDARGRKFVVFLSPSWFLAPTDQHARDGAHRQFVKEFSPEQAGSLLLNPRLDGLLTAKIADRLLSHRDIVETASPLLRCALDATQGGAPWRTAWRCALRPLLMLQTGFFRLQDRLRTAQLVPSAPPPAPALEVGKPGDPVPAPNVTAALSGADPLPRLYIQGDNEFLTRLNASKEWTDLKLLLETIRRIGARVLLIGQPFNGATYGAWHVSEPARRQYYERIRALADAHGVPLSDFADREDDETFFADLVHPSASAWTAYDQALEQFYHQPN